MDVLGPGEAGDGVEPLFDRVVRGGDGLAVDLEIVQRQVGAVGDRLDQWPIPLRSRRDAAGHADDLRFHTGARLRITSSAASTRFGSSPTHLMTSSLVSKLG